MYVLFYCFNKLKKNPCLSVITRVNNEDLIFRSNGASTDGGHNRTVDDLTPTQASFLRLWIRYFTVIISDRWSKTQPENSETKASSKRVEIRPTYSAFVAFS